MSDNHERRSSLRDRQVDLTRELIMRAFQGLLQSDHPDAITFPQVAEAAGVSLRTVYRYFPTRADLLQSAAAWFREFANGVRWDDPRTVRDLSGALPQMGRLFDEHTNVFRALADHELEEPRRAAVAAAVAEVSGNLPADGDEIVAALDWAASTLLEDVRRRNEAAS
jgi:AcrR family transcriptional regulator